MTTSVRQALNVVGQSVILKQLAHQRNAAFPLSLRNFVHAPPPDPVLPLRTAMTTSVRQALNVVGQSVSLKQLAHQRNELFPLSLRHFVGAPPPGPTDLMIYFQGTDDKLWRINPDGSGGVNLGGYKTKSTPTVFGQYIYFQGTDNKLWRINLDGNGGTDLGGYATNSTPFVAAGYVYFRGTDDKLWQITMDGKSGVNLGGYKTKSMPYAAGGYVYFQGTDNKLWRILLDGTQGINLGLYTTASTPFVTEQYVYFQGTDNKLWRINLNGTGGVNLGGYHTQSSPFVTADYIYFQGTDDKLWQINLDGSGGRNLGGYKTKSAPFVTTEFVYFQGTDDALWRINLDGTNGTHLQGYNTSSTPFVVNPLNQPLTGALRPRYHVLTVVYAPPGTNGGKSTSSVDYGSGSSTGTTTSVSKSFKWGLDVSASISIPISPAVALGLSGDFNYSSTNTDSESIEIKKTNNFDIKVQGPGADGIDHNHDLFYLWLNPLLNVTIDPENNLAWELGVDGPDMVIQYVYVSWLKNPSSIPPGVKQLLDSAGLTLDDYATILGLNPFASGATVIDPNRYTAIPQSFPYEPPFSTTDPVPVQTYSLQSSLTYTSGQATVITYGVSVGVSASSPDGGDKDKDKGSLKVTGTFAWTNSSSSSTSNVSSESASVAIGGPAFGYTGATDVLVYLDGVYNSFMFAFPTELPVASGTLTDSLGKPVAHKLVTLAVGAARLSTYSDAKGGYRFYGAPSGKGKVSVEGKEFAVPVGPGSQKATLHLT
jgi:PQQ-like domain